MCGNAHDSSATSCRETKRPCTPCSAREPSFWPLQWMRIEGGICHHLRCTSYVLLDLQHDLHSCKLPLPVVSARTTSVLKRYHCLSLLFSDKSKTLYGLSSPLSNIYMLALFQQLITPAPAGAESKKCCTYLLTAVCAAVVCTSLQLLETLSALVCCVRQALILILVTNKVTMQPSHVPTALPTTVP